MPVLLNLRAISAAFLISVIGACKPASQAPAKADASYESLTDQLGQIQIQKSDLEGLPGDTRAEKLLYQAGIVSQLQSAMLVTFDTQVRTVRVAGNAKLADELEKNRPIMMEAVNLELSGMIKDAGKLYESHFSPEDIERLIVLHSDPAMKKLTLTQPKIVQGMLPIGEKFGQRVGARYEKLVKEK